jgi:hypothetical protein
MMIAKSLLLLFPMLCSAVRAAPAQDSVSVEPTVVAVVTGGRWTSEGRAGYYRVIIRTGGFGHTTSDLTVQWLAEPTRDDGPSVVRSVAVKELSDLARLDRPQIGQYFKGWRIWLQVTDTRADPGKQTTRAIDIGAPGEFKVVRMP